MPADAKRETEQGTLNCADKCFGDEEKQGLLILTAMMAGFSICPQGKKINTITSGMLRACVTQGANGMDMSCPLSHTAVSLYLVAPQ